MKLSKRDKIFGMNPTGKIYRVRNKEFVLYISEGYRLEIKVEKDKKKL